LPGLIHVFRNQGCFQLVPAGTVQGGLPGALANHLPLYCICFGFYRDGFGPVSAINRIQRFNLSRQASLSAFSQAAGKWVLLDPSFRKDI
jgi:hypothetical protein